MDRVYLEYEGKRIYGFFERIGEPGTKYILATDEITGIAITFNQLSRFNGLSKLGGHLVGHEEPVVFELSDECTIEYKHHIIRIDRPVMCKIFELVRSDHFQFRSAFLEFK